jgi:hypothetical protein
MVKHLWSRGRLYHALKTALLRKDVRLRLRHLKTEAGYISINDHRRPHKIALDPYQIGVISGVLHELLHFVVGPRLEPLFNRELEERFVVDLTTYFSSHVLNSINETEWWRAAIERKLKATPAGGKPCT